MFSFRSLNLLFLIIFFGFGFNAFGQNKRKPVAKKTNSSQIVFAFNIGLYTGNAENTTSIMPLTGEVEFNLIDANKNTGEIDVSMLFKNGLCGEGNFTGIIDDKGFSLSGILSCGSRSMKMITRCSYKSSDTLYCDFKLLPSQKGNFTITKFKTPTNQNVTTYKKRYDTSKAFPTQDVGVDLAVVAVEEINMRDQPNESSSLIKKLSYGSLLVVVDREKNNGWINVIDVESGKDGWVKADDIDVKYTQKRQPTSQLDRSPTSSTRPPEIEVFNDSNVTLYLNFGGSKYTILANDSVKFTIEPGRYKFYASSPGVLPDFGEDMIQTGFSYIWRFYIVTR